jgi:hypothetical protein
MSEKRSGRVVAMWTVRCLGVTTHFPTNDSVRAGTASARCRVAESCAASARGAREAGRKGPGRESRGTP